MGEYEKARELSRMFGRAAAREGTGLIIRSPHGIHTAIKFESVGDPAMNEIFIYAALIGSALGVSFGLATAYYLRKAPAGKAPDRDSIPVMLLPGETLCPLTKGWCVACRAHPCEKLYRLTSHGWERLG